MVLAVDIGNSNICIGGLSGAGHRDILFTVRMVTRPRCTADEYAAELRFLLARLQVDARRCEGVIVCSVVPGLTGVLAAACERLTGCTAMIVSCELDCGMTFKVDEPARVGRDRIADAAAAAAYYPLPCMTVDLGTATTYNVISENAEFLGGFIVPGVQTSLRAISKGTAQLPPIAPRAAGGADWAQHGGSTEQRRDVRHGSHAGWLGTARAGAAGQTADRCRHRRSGALYHALLSISRAVRCRPAVQGAGVAVGEKPVTKQE